MLSLAMTINDIRNEGFTVMNTISLVTDVAAVILPIVPAGVSQALRAAKYASKAVNAVDTAADTMKVANKLDNFLDGAKNLAKKADDIVCPIMNSFQEDTSVATQEGDQAIAAIEIGDYVLAWDEESGEIGYYQVTDAFHHTDQIVTELIIDGEWIETTPEHPFYVEGKGWVDAEDLRTGDKVRQSDGTTGIVWLQWNVHKTQAMYNLTVDTAHTFFVGEGQWLVHNCSAKKTSNILNNKEKGDAFRDEIAGAFEDAGYSVRKEVVKKTPFGNRRIDIEVTSPNGDVLGGVETKLGGSRYLPSQRAKDFWLKMQGYIVNVLRRK